MESGEIGVISRRQFRLGLLATVAIVGIWFLWLVRGGLYPFVLGIFFAYLLHPFVCFFERKGMQRVWALVFVYTGLFSLLLGLGLKLAPLLVRELENFAGDLPRMSDNAEAMLNTWQHTYEHWALPVSMRAALDASVAQAVADADSFVRGLIGGILGLFSYMIGLAVSPILAFYILYDWKTIKEKIVRFVPSSWRTELIAIFKSVNRVLDGVIRGQLLISAAVGIVVTIGLFWLGIRYALLIGILAGVLDVIPYFGAIIGALPAVGLALVYSPVMALKVAILFFFVHQLEGSVIQPKIIGSTVGLHPLAVIFFVFVGGELGGIVGMLAGVPVAAIGKVIFQHIFKWIV